MDNPFTIESVRGMMAIDSRGRPTVKASVRTRGGLGTALAPSGASRGKYEAWELRDRDPARFRGLGVNKAITNINSEIAPRLVGMDSRRQVLIDATMRKLDGTPNLARLGGNAIVAVSLAVAKAAASTAGMELYRYLGGPSARTLPVPLMNIINGGVHAGNELDFQEFMVAPVGADSFREALRMAVEVYWSLKDLLKEKYGALAVNVGDEGGFAPPMRRPEEALGTLVEAVRRTGYEPGSDLVFALDVAASQLYDGDRGVYRVAGEEYTKYELLDYYVGLVDQYPVVSIEDPFHEDDYEAFKELTERLGRRILVVGDDLYVTNPERLRRGIELGASNAVLVKVNQVGTLSDALRVVEEAHRSSMRAIISHRSGETEDTSIADIAVATNSGLIKTGAPARGERTAKYNRLLEIEDELAGEARYPGEEVFPGRVS